jgi:RNA polymerase sigma factor (sigma-70 family)
LNERELDGLMDRLADGDRTAFEPLFIALWPRAVAAARRRLEAHAADDVAQATMLKLFAHAPEFRRGSPVLPWFYAIAANEIRGAGRSRRADPDDAALAAMSSGDDPERAALDRELRAALAACVEALDPSSAEAIAILLGDKPRPRITEAAFRKRVSRAYAKLRMLLGGYGER